MVDVNKHDHEVTLSIEEYDELLQAAGRGEHVLEQPNNDGLRPLEKPEDAGTIGTKKNWEDEGLSPVVKNVGREPEIADSDPTKRFKVEGDTIDSREGFDSNEYLAGRSMDLIPEVVVDPRKEDPEEVEDPEYPKGEDAGKTVRKPKSKK